MGGIGVPRVCIVPMPTKPSLLRQLNFHRTYLLLSETLTVLEKQMQLGCSNLLQYHQFQKALGCHGTRVT